MSRTEGFHPMREPRIEKVVVHMGVGRGGRELQNAEAILEDITGQESVRTRADETVPDWGIREGDPIGAKVTLRGERAHAFLGTAFDLVEIDPGQFDETGNVSFGIDEHTDFPEQEYDPEVGIFGLDVTVVLARPGRRIARRDDRTRTIPAGHQLSREDAIEYLQATFDVEVTET